ncbi:MAG: hypothetical protein R8G66_05345 [Cytophagales bacterium]|nr:hypothetical protein [Cytophagales bacterium]
MKAFGKLIWIVVMVGFWSCTSGTDELQVRESVYILHRVSTTAIEGRVTFTEVGPTTVQVAITLSGTEEGLPFPAHLHFGTVNETGELAFRLNDVDGATGESITMLENERLTDGSELTYDLLQEINGSVKIHMNVPEGSAFSNFAVATGNIGTNSREYDPNSITVCVGH